MAANSGMVRTPTAAFLSRRKAFERSRRRYCRCRMGLRADERRRRQVLGLGHVWPARDRYDRNETSTPTAVRSHQRRPRDQREQPPCLRAHGRRPRQVLGLDLDRRLAPKTTATSLSTSRGLEAVTRLSRRRHPRLRDHQQWRVSSAGAPTAKASSETAPRPTATTQ